MDAAHDAESYEALRSTIGEASSADCEPGRPESWALALVDRLFRNGVIAYRDIPSLARDLIEWMERTGHAGPPCPTEPAGPDPVRPRRRAV